MTSTRDPPLQRESDSIIGGDAALSDAAVDERLELLATSLVEWRRLVRGEQLLPDPVRLAGKLRRARLLPRLVIPPVGQHRLVECGLEPRLGVLGPEEVAAGSDLLDGGEGEALVVDH